MGKIVLGLDLDGVLYDWHSAVYTYFQYIKNYQGTYRQFWTEFINDTSKEEQEFIVSIPFLYSAITPSKQVIEFLNFAADNSEIYYITSRPDSVEHITKKYVKEYFPYPDNLFSVHDKATTCRYLGVTHFLDDHEKHVKAVQPVANSFLKARCWNEYCQDQYNTVYSLKEFKEIVF